MVSKERKEKMIAETKLLVELFLENKASDIELAKMTGISSSTVGRRLTNRENICLAFPENGPEIFNKVGELRQENLRMAKIIGGQASMHNRTYIKDEMGKFQGSTHLRLDIFYPSIKEQIQLLMHIALTFRAKLPLLAELFHIEEKELLNLLMTHCGSAYNSLLYLFYHDSSDQEVAKQNIITFYRDFLDAKRSKNIHSTNEVVRKVTDYEASNIIKNGLVAENMEIIIRYQLKYALSIGDVVSTFNISENDYRKGIKSLLEIYPELKQRYEELSDYNYNKKNQDYMNEEIFDRGNKK